MLTIDLDQGTTAPLDQLDRTLNLMERCTDLLERLGGLSDEDRRTVRDAVLCGLTLQMTVLPSPQRRAPAPVAITADAGAPAPTQTDLSDLLAPAAAQATEDAMTAAEKGLPRYPTIGEVWRALYGTDPNQNQAQSCGHYLAKSHRREFRTTPPLVYRQVNGKPRQYRRYKRDWMVAKVREFAASRAI